MTTEDENPAAAEAMDEMTDRFDSFFANEGNPSGHDPENPEEPDFDAEDDSGFSDDEPFLKDDPDYDPDELDDPDNPKEAETAREDDDAADDDDEEDDKPAEKPEDKPEDKADDGEDGEPEPDPKALKAEFMADVVEEFKKAGLDPNMGKAFASTKYDLKMERAENARLKAEGVNTPEMKDLAAKAQRVSEVEVELKAAQDKLALFDFQTTPEYKKEIEAPFQAISSVAHNIETAASMPEGSILKAISVGDKATQDANIQNLVDSYNIAPRDVNTIFNKADDMLALTAKDAELRTTAQERLGESRAQQEAREAYQAEQEKSVYRDSVHNTFKEYEGQIGAFLNDDGTNNEAWKEAIKDSESYDFKGDPELQGLGAFALSAVPHLMEQNNKFSAEIAKLKALVNRSKSVKPPSVSRTASSGGGGKSATNPTMSLSDALGARLRAGR